MEERREAEERDADLKGWAGKLMKEHEVCRTDLVVFVASDVNYISTKSTIMMVQNDHK